MTFLEFLDRRAERRAQAGPLVRFDTKTLIGFGFLAGYYVLIFRFTINPVPAANVQMIRDAMLVLGPPVGMIVGAIFRESNSDVQAKANTGAAFQAIAAVANAGGAPTPDVTLKPGETAQAAEPNGGTA